MLLQDSVSFAIFAFMKHFIGFALMLVTLSSCQSQELPDSFTKVDPAQMLALKEKHDNFVLLDVRTPQEIKEGYLEGATFLDYMSEDFKGSLEKLDRERIYGVYCQSGIRSNNTMQMMQSMGFRQVYDMDGGYLRYLQQQDD